MVYGSCRIFLLLALATSTLVDRAQAYGGYEVDRLEGKVIHFKAPDGKQAPEPLQTSLHDLKFLGTLTSESSPPYFLVSGRACSDCSDEKSLYLFRKKGGARPSQFVYPGRILDPKTRQLLLESRVFFGKCLPESVTSKIPGNPTDILLAFQKEHVDRKAKLQHSVFIAAPGKEHLEEKLLERGLPKMDFTLKRVKSRQCVEIEGRNRLMLKKPLDLNPRRGSGEDDKETDDQVKESQTAEELPSAEQ